MARTSRTHRFLRQIAAAVCLLSFLTPQLEAQPRGNRLMPRYVTVAPPDQEEGRRILAEFRQLGLPGDYYLRFVLEVLPRRGARFEVPGEMWGGRLEHGSVERLVLRPIDGPEKRLLVQHGIPDGAWTWSTSGDVERLPLTQTLEPLAGTHATPFDLQMPYVHWKDFVFEGVARVRGRTAHSFLLYPPADFAVAHPNIGGVRLYLDMQFRAPMQAVLLDANERPARTMTVLDLKRVSGQWMVKSIDIRDEATRDKTRMRITGASLDLELAPQLFTPAALMRQVPPPPKIERID
jgi:hypothetical protein